MLRFTYWTFIILFLFIPVFCSGALGKRKTDDSSSVIQAKDNLLTVNVKDIPLNKVLMEIANQVPIKIVLFTPAKEHLVANFSQLPMEEGLEQLLSNYNYVFIYGHENPKGVGREIRKAIILSRTKSLDDNISKSIVELKKAHFYFSQLHENIGQLEEKLEQQNEILEKRLLDRFEEALKTLQYQQ